MTSHRLPPIHDAVRLWHENEAATLRACISYRQRTPPSWSLSWLRKSAHFIFSGQISERALRQAVFDNVPTESQRSVLRGLTLLLNSIRKHRWRGNPLASLELDYNGLSLEISPVGQYFSEILKTKILIALQPRSEEVPSLEQFRIWSSILYYNYIGVLSDASGVLIVDISKNNGTGKRELSELSEKKLFLIDRHDLDERLNSVAACYLRAIEIVPELPRREPNRSSGGQKNFGF